MKKVFALLVACMMLLSCAAFAEDAQLPAIVFDETAVTFEGAWMGFGDYGFAIFLPTDAEAIELTDEDTANGVVAAFSFAGGKLVVTAGAVDETVTLDSLVTYLTDAGDANAQMVTVNDMTVVVGDNAENDVSRMVWITEDGIEICLTAAPASDAEFTAVGSVVMTSVSSYVAEETTEEAE